MDSPGRIELISGPMFSGKTREMVARVEMAAFAKVDVLVVRFADDLRYGGDSVATHSGARLRDSPATAARGALRVAAARELGALELAPGERVVGVDEGQFYPDLAVVAARWALEGRRVVVAALDGDAAGRPFDSVSALYPHCDTVEKRHGVCASCGRPSVYSVRTAGYDSGPNAVAVGGAESYAATCRACRAGRK